MPVQTHFEGERHSADTWGTEWGSWSGSGIETSNGGGMHVHTTEPHGGWVLYLGIWGKSKILQWASFFLVILRKSSFIEWSRKSDPDIIYV